jgi:hypothetical protein
MDVLDIERPAYNQEPSPIPLPISLTTLSLSLYPQPQPTGLTSYSQPPLLQQPRRTITRQQARLVDLCLSFRCEQVQLAGEEGVQGGLCRWVRGV